MAEIRTPMAWQHRDAMNGPPRQNNDNGRRYTPTPNSRYGGPPTPNSAHSRNSRTPDQRRDTRGSSSDRYSHNSTRKLVRDTRSAQGSSRGSRGGGYRSQPSPSSTEETAEETTETDSQMEQQQHHHQQRGHAQEYPQFQQPFMYPQPGYFPMGYPVQPQLMGPVAPPQFLMAPNGSIRSVHSVPMLASAASATPSIPPLSHTWDGEPCPVHHHQAMPLAALYGLGPHHMLTGPASVPPSIISGATTVRRARSIAEISNSGMYQVPSMPGTPHLDHRSFHGSMMIRNGKFVVSENGAPSQLPMREQKNGKASTLPHSMKDQGGFRKESEGIACCSGHFVVLWIILGIITFGILLGVVLMFTVG